MKTIESKPILRPYQEACIEAVTGALARGLTRVYYVLPTGSGKTVIFVSLIDRLLKPGHPALVIAHREELLTQARESILRANPHLSVGIERADCRAPRTCDVVVASIQTIGRKGSTRLEWLRNIGPSCIIVDEAHHIAADGYGRAIDFMTTLNPLIPVIGCTATPSRLDKIALHGAKGAVFQDCVYSYPIRQAIDDGYLCQLRGYRVAVVDCDLSKVKVVAGDYSAKSLAEAINVEARTVKAMEHWREHCQDRQTIVFCADVAHAESAAKVWADAGYATACVTGAMDTEDRRRTLAAYKQHKLQVLCNCQVLTEGYDNPATSAIVMLRPTKSWALYCQCIGRGTRIHPGKQDLVVIDVVDNSAEHRLDEMPEANLVKPETPRGTGQEDASVSTLLGLPAGIDLEGHTVTEIANLKDQLTMESALFERYRPETYSDLVTMIEKVDLFAGLTQGEVKAAIPAARYAWVQRGQDWVLNVKDGTATIRRDADGQWWVRVVTPDADPHIMALRTQDTGEAIDKAERIAEGLIENLGMARVDARWRNDKPSEGQLGLLRRWGIAPAMIAAMSKGEASAFITRKFASRGR